MFVTIESFNIHRCKDKRKIEELPIELARFEGDNGVRYERVIYINVIEILHPEWS